MDSWVNLGLAYGPFIFAKIIVFLEILQTFNKQT